MANHRGSFSRWMNDALRVVLATLVASTGPNLRAATLLQWDIPTSASGSSGTTNASPPINGAGVSGITGSQITIFGSLAGTTSSGGWRWYDQAGNTDLSTALSGTNYFSWSVTTNGVTTATITGLGPTSFSKGASAPNSLALLYSTTADFGTYRTISGSTAIPSSTSSDISSGLAGDLASNNIVLAPGSTGYFRLAFWGATTTTSGAIWTGSNSTTSDFSLLGTSSNSVAQRSLVWNGAGGGGSTWDSSIGNLVWLDSGTATYFNDGDNATFAAPSTVNVAAGGVSAGTVTVSNTTGSLALQGGPLTATQVVKSGAGVLDLSGSNSLGALSASGGTVQIGTNGSLGAAVVTLDNAQITTAAGVTALANAMNIGVNGGILSVGGTTTFSGVVNTTGAAANQSVVLTKAGAGTMTVTKAFGTQMTKNTTGGAFTLNVDNGSLVFSGNVQRNLGGTNTWNGNVSSTGGTFMLHAATLAGSGTFSIDGVTTLQSRLSFGRSTVGNRLVVNAPLTLNASASASLDLTGVMTGTGGITVSAGSGMVRILGTPTDGVNTLGGAFAVSGTTEAYSQSLGNLVPTVAASQLLRFINILSGTFAGAITGAGRVGIAGSAPVTLSGSNAYAGGTDLNGEVVITSVWDGSAGSLGSGVITALSSSAKISLDPSVSSPFTFSQAVNTGTGGGTLLAFAGSGKTYLLTGSAAGNGQLKASSGATLDLTSQTAATNTNTGGIEVGNAYVRAASDDNLGAGPVNFSGTDLTSGWIAAASGTITRAITIGATGTNANVKAIFDTSGNNLTLTGGIGNKANTALGQLIKKGAGTLTLSSSNGYTGLTTVSAGTLALANPAALAGSTLDLSAADAGTVVFTASGTNTYALGGLSGSRGLVTSGSANIAIGGNGSSTTYSGTLSGGGSLMKVGSGTLQLTGNNTFSGPTLVAQGALRIGGAGALASTAVTVAAGATLSVGPQVQATVPSLSNNGQVDVGLGRITVSSGLTAQTVTSQIMDGIVMGGTTGITSSNAASSGGAYSVGWIDNFDGSYTFGYAAAGDTNLDNVVDLTDLLNTVGSGLYDTGNPANWSEGDFNYDGVSDLTDLLSLVGGGLYDQGDYNPPSSQGLLAALSADGSGGLTLLGGPDPGLAAGGVAAVPEPATVFPLVAAVGIGLALRGGRWRRKAAILV